MLTANREQLLNTLVWGRSTLHHMVLQFHIAHIATAHGWPLIRGTLGFGGIHVERG